MTAHKDHTEIKKHLTKIRKGISEHTSISAESKKKAIAKLDTVQAHVDEGKVTETTAEHLRDIITHLEENPVLIDLIEEALPYLPH